MTHDSTPAEDVFAPLGAFLLRQSLAAMWLSHAIMKIDVFTVAGFAQWLETMGIPGVLAGPVIAVEIAGGLAIAFGFFGRFVSLALLPVLAVATWTHWPNGWLFTAAGGGWEYPVFLMAASLAHLLIGDGLWAAKTATFAQVRALFATDPRAPELA